MRDDLLNPIPGENPSGENLRYAPIYDQIKEARREEEAGGSLGDWQRDIKKADWLLVIKLAGEAIAKKSKDLQLAAWLTEASIRKDGFPGLKDGLDLMRGLIENFWETLYPELEDGDSEMRAAPLEWVGSRLDDSLRKVPLTQSKLDWLKYKEARAVGYETDTAKAEARAAAIEEGKMTAEQFDDAVDHTPKSFYDERFATLTGCLESLGALDDVCAERFADYAPNFGKLKSALEEIKQVVYIFLQKKREAEPDAEPVEAAPEAEAAPEPEAVSADSYAAAVPARAPAPKPKRGALAAEPADRDDAVERVVTVARWIRQQEPYSPVPYMLLRGLRWGELRANGAEPDAALLEPPPTEVRQQLRNFARDGQWTELLEAAEAAMGMPCGRAWLDLQRHVVRACEELGSYYDPIASAVKSGLRALLADIPNLPEMSLTDDTPAANAETQAWIREHVAAPAAPAPAVDDWAPAPEPEQEAGEQAEAGPPDAYQLALEAAQSGRVEEAIETLTREAAQERSGRARFQRRVQLAQICLASGHEAIARPILDEVAAEIDRRQLESWEAGDTLAHALALLYRSMAKMDAPEDERRKIYARICRLDAVQALACSR